MNTILKKLRSLPMLGLVAVAAVLSVVLGCGGNANGNAAPGNVVTIDMAGTIDPTNGDSIATVGFNIANNSTSSITSAVFFDNTGSATTKYFSPLVGPGQVIAVIAKVKVSQTTNSSGTTGSTTTTTTYASTTNAITVAISATSGSNQSFTLGISVDPTTGKLTLTPGSSVISFTGTGSGLGGNP